MKISTFAFIGSLLAIRLEKVHSDNNQVKRQHRKDEEVVSVDEIVGESSIGSVRAGRRSDREKENKRHQRSNKHAGGETNKSDEEDSNRRSGNKRGSDETDKSDGKRGGGGRRGGRNADDNEESQENIDEKRGGGRDGGGGGHKRKNNKRGNRDGQGASGHPKKHDNKKKQRTKEGRKFRKKLVQENQQVTQTGGVALVSPSELVGGVPPPAEIVPPLAEEEFGYGIEEVIMDKKLMGKSEKESPVEAEEVEHEMMEKEDNLMAKSFKESVHKGPHEQVPKETTHENAKHEMKREDNLMAKSMKESVHKGPHEQIPIPTETTYESSNTVETAAGTSKRKQRYVKPSREYRRRNHPRQHPPPPSGGSNGGRFAVPSAAKQKTPGKQRHDGLASKNDKMAP